MVGSLPAASCSTMLGAEVFKAEKVDDSSPRHDRRRKDCAQRSGKARLVFGSEDGQAVRCKVKVLMRDQRPSAGEEAAWSG